MNRDEEREARFALNIATAMDQVIAEIERRWVPSKRGSNGQRALDDLKARRATLEQCLLDALDGGKREDGNG